MHEHRESREYYSYSRDWSGCHWQGNNYSVDYSHPRWQSSNSNKLGHRFHSSNGNNNWGKEHLNVRQQKSGQHVSSVRPHYHYSQGGHFNAMSRSTKPHASYPVRSHKHHQTDKHGDKKVVNKTMDVRYRHREVGSSFGHIRPTNSSSKIDSVKPKTLNNVDSSSVVNKKGETGTEEEKSEKSENIEKPQVCDESVSGEFELSSLSDCTNVSSVKITCIKNSKDTKNDKEISVTKARNSFKSRVKGRRSFPQRERKIKKICSCEKNKVHSEISSKVYEKYKDVFSREPVICLTRINDEVIKKHRSSFSLSGDTVFKPNDSVQMKSQFERTDTLAKWLANSQTAVLETESVAKSEVLSSSNHQNKAVDNSNTLNFIESASENLSGHLQSSVEKEDPTFCNTDMSLVDPKVILLSKPLQEAAKKSKHSAIKLTITKETDSKYSSGQDVPTSTVPPCVLKCSHKESGITWERLPEDHVKMAATLKKKQNDIIFSSLNKCIENKSVSKLSNISWKYNLDKTVRKKYETDECSSATGPSRLNESNIQKTCKNTEGNSLSTSSISLNSNFCKNSSHQTISEKINTVTCTNTTQSVNVSSIQNTVNQSNISHVTSVQSKKISDKVTHSVTSVQSNTHSDKRTDKVCTKLTWHNLHAYYQKLNGDQIANFKSGFHKKSWHRPEVRTQICDKQNSINEHCMQKSLTVQDGELNGKCGEQRMDISKGSGESCFSTGTNEENCRESPIVTLDKVFGVQNKTTSTGNRLTSERNMSTDKKQSTSVLTPHQDIPQMIQVCDDISFKESINCTTGDINNVVSQKKDISPKNHAETTTVCSTEMTECSEESELISKADQVSNADYISDNDGDERTLFDKVANEQKTIQQRASPDLGMDISGPRIQCNRSINKLDFSGNQLSTTFADSMQVVHPINIDEQKLNNVFTLKTSEKTPIYSKLLCPPPKHLKNVDFEDCDKSYKLPSESDVISIKPESCIPRQAEIIGIVKPSSVNSAPMNTKLQSEITKTNKLPLLVDGVSNEMRDNESSQHYEFHDNIKSVSPTSVDVKNCHLSVSPRGSCIDSNYVKNPIPVAHNEIVPSVYNNSISGMCDSIMQSSVVTVTETDFTNEKNILPSKSSVIVASALENNFNVPQHKVIPQRIDSSQNKMPVPSENCQLISENCQLIIKPGSVYIDKADEISEADVHDYTTKHAYDKGSSHSTENVKGDTLSNDHNSMLQSDGDRVEDNEFQSGDNDKPLCIITSVESEALKYFSDAYDGSSKCSNNLIIDTDQLSNGSNEKESSQLLSSPDMPPLERVQDISLNVKDIHNGGCGDSEIYFEDAPNLEEQLDVRRYLPKQARTDGNEGQIVDNMLWQSISVNVTEDTQNKDSTSPVGLPLQNTLKMTISRVSESSCGSSNKLVSRLEGHNTLGPKEISRIVSAERHTETVDLSIDCGKSDSLLQHSPLNVDQFKNITKEKGSAMNRNHDSQMLLNESDQIFSPSETVPQATEILTAIEPSCGNSNSSKHASNRYNQTVRDDYSNGTGSESMLKNDSSFEEDENDTECVGQSQAVNLDTQSKHSIQPSKDLNDGSVSKLTDQGTKCFLTTPVEIAADKHPSVLPIDLSSNCQGHSDFENDDSTNDVDTDEEAGLVIDLTFRNKEQKCFDHEVCSPSDDLHQSSNMDLINKGSLRIKNENNTENMINSSETVFVTDASQQNSLSTDVSLLTQTYCPAVNEDAELTSKLNTVSLRKSNVYGKNVIDIIAQKLEEKSIIGDVTDQSLDEPSEISANLLNTSNAPFNLNVDCKQTDPEQFLVKVEENNELKQKDGFYVIDTEPHFKAGNIEHSANHSLNSPNIFQGNDVSQKDNSAFGTQIDQNEYCFEENLDGDASVNSVTAVSETRETKDRLGKLITNLKNDIELCKKGKVLPGVVMQKVKRKRRRFLGMRRKRRISTKALLLSLAGDSWEFDSYNSDKPESASEESDITGKGDNKTNDVIKHTESENDGENVRGAIKYETKRKKSSRKRTILQVAKKISRINTPKKIFFSKMEKRGQTAQECSNKANTTGFTDLSDIKLEPNPLIKQEKIDSRTTKLLTKRRKRPRMKSVYPIKKEEACENSASETGGDGDEQLNTDSEDLPTIHPPKRRKHEKGCFSKMSKNKEMRNENCVQRIIQEFPRHNWLEQKINNLTKSSDDLVSEKSQDSAKSPVSQDHSSQLDGSTGSVYEQQSNGNETADDAKSDHETKDETIRLQDIKDESVIENCHKTNVDNCVGSDHDDREDDREASPKNNIDEANFLASALKVEADEAEGDNISDKTLYLNASRSSTDSLGMLDLTTRDKSPESVRSNISRPKNFSEDEFMEVDSINGTSLEDMATDVSVVGTDLENRSISDATESAAEDIRHEESIRDGAAGKEAQPLDLCTGFRENHGFKMQRTNNNPPVQMVHPHVHRPPSPVLPKNETATEQPIPLIQQTKELVSNALVISEPEPAKTEAGEDRSNLVPGAEAAQVIAYQSDLLTAIEVPASLADQIGDKVTLLPMPTSATHLSQNTCSFVYSSTSVTTDNASALPVNMVSTQPPATNLLPITQTLTSTESLPPRGTVVQNPLMIIDGRAPLNVVPPTETSKARQANSILPRPILPKPESGRSSLDQTNQGPIEKSAILNENSSCSQNTMKNQSALSSDSRENVLQNTSAVGLDLVCHKKSINNSEGKNHSNMYEKQMMDFKKLEELTLKKEKELVALNKIKSRMFNYLEKQKMRKLQEASSSQLTHVSSVSVQPVYTQANTHSQIITTNSYTASHGLDFNKQSLGNQQAQTNPDSVDTKLVTGDKPPPAHRAQLTVNQMLVKRLKAIVPPPSVQNSCPYMRRQSAIHESPFGRTNIYEGCEPVKAHCQPPFHIAGSLIVPVSSALKKKHRSRFPTQAMNCHQQESNYNNPDINAQQKIPYKHGHDSLKTMYDKPFIESSVQNISQNTEHHLTRNSNSNPGSAVHLVTATPLSPDKHLDRVVQGKPDSLQATSDQCNHAVRNLNEVSGKICNSNDLLISTAGDLNVRKADYIQQHIIRKGTSDSTVHYHPKKDSPDVIDLTTSTPTGSLGVRYENRTETSVQKELKNALRHRQHSLHYPSGRPVLQNQMQNQMQPDPHQKLTVQNFQNIARACNAVNCDPHVSYSHRNKYLQYKNPREPSFPRPPLLAQQTHGFKNANTRIHPYAARSSMPCPVQQPVELESNKHNHKHVYYPGMFGANTNETINSHDHCTSGHHNVHTNQEMNISPNTDFQTLYDASSSRPSNVPSMLTSVSGLNNHPNTQISPKFTASNTMGVHTNSNMSPNAVHAYQQQAGAPITNQGLGYRAPPLQYDHNFNSQHRENNEHIPTCDILTPTTYPGPKYSTQRSSMYMQNPHFSSSQQMRYQNPPVVFTTIAPRLSVNNRMIMAAAAPDIPEKSPGGHCYHSPGSSPRMMEPMTKRMMIPAVSRYPSTIQQPTLVPRLLQTPPVRPPVPLPQAPLRNIPNLTQVKKNCAVCGKTAPYFCAQCRKLWYCSTECQEHHWGVMKHRDHCTPT